MNEDYIKRINRVLEYIENHLEHELSLEKIATIGCYSPFHLHRIFKTITKETLNTYVTRKRIEKTAAILLHQKTITIGQIAQQYGFNSNAVYSRTFKKIYGISPKEFQKSKPEELSKIRQQVSKNGQNKVLFEEYICNIETLKNWINMNAKIEIKEMPALKLAYITQIGHQGLGTAFDQLLKWAIPKGLLENPETKVLTIFHDSYKITDPQKVRMSACISIPETIKTDSSVGLTKLERCNCIVGYFEIQMADFEKSWTSLFLWMNQNGYKKANKNPFEIYHNNFNEHPQKLSFVSICIPIE